MARFTALYETLEVTADCDEAALKKAYRRLAVKFHPDKNPGDKTAEEKFKQISHAYEILNNPDKRKIYDEYGEEGLNNRGGGGFSSNPFDIFNDLFGGGGGGNPFESFFGGGGGRPRNPNAPMRGADLRYNLEITLQEAFSGINRKIEFKRAGLCQECHGSGCARGTHPEPCKRCGGRGQVGISQGFFTMMQDCPSCRGKGSTIPKKCPKCNGAGTISIPRSIELRIPAGVDTGTRMRVSNEGEPGRNGGPNGDLYIIIQIKEDANFEREDSDIYATLHIPFHLAALGGTIMIPTVQGQTELTIPAGTQNDDMLTLRGKGMPVFNHPGSWGSHHVKLIVDVPKKLSEEQKEALKAYAALFDVKNSNQANADKENADPNGFFQKAKDFFTK